MRAPILLVLTLLLSGAPAALTTAAATSGAYAPSAAPQVAATPAQDTATTIPTSRAPRKGPFTWGRAPIAGEKVKVKGKVPKAGKRRSVTVQLKSKKRWKTVAKTMSRKNGKFRTQFKAKRGGKLRVKAAKTGRTRAHTSGARKFKVAKQSGRLTVPTVVLQSQQATMKARFKPARPGRKVVLSGRSDGKWTQVARGVQDGKGRVTFTTVASTIGTFQYRATAVRAKGAKQKHTKARSMRIDAFDVEIHDDVVVLTDAEQESVRSVDLTNGVVTFLANGAPALTGGEVISIAPTTGAPSGALRRVTSVSTVSGLFRAVTSEATLLDVVERMPETEGGIAMCSIATTVSDVTEGTTLRGVEPDDPDCAAPPATGSRLDRTARATGTIEISAPTISLGLAQRGTLSSDSGLGLGYTVSGAVAAAPFLELGVGTNWRGQVKSYRAGAGVDWNNSTTVSVEASATAQAETIEKLDLAQVSRTFRGFLGIVPVWGDLSGSLVTTVGVEGSGGVSLVQERVGRDAAGVKNKASGDLSPTLYQSGAPSENEVTSVTAAGKVFAGVGAEVQLDAYSLAGPYVGLGAKAEFTASWSSSAGTSCVLGFGPYAEVGLQTSDLLDKLTGGSLAGSVSWEVFLDVQTPNLCPPGTDLDPDLVPVITTSSLPDGVVGTPYTADLETQGDVSGVWARTSGSLPPGLTMDVGGRLTGTPTTAGTSTFTVQFTAANGKTATKTLTLVVTQTGSASCGASTLTAADCRAMLAIRDTYPTLPWEGEDPCTWIYPGDVFSQKAVTCSGGRVIDVELQGPAVTTLAPEIGDLTALSRLGLSDTGVTSLPGALVARLGTLRSIQIFDTPITALPPEIGTLGSLRLLTVMGTDITALPAELGNVSTLLELEVGSNKLTSLPPQLAELPHLWSLRAERNELTSIPSWVWEKTTLGRLDYSNNNVSGPVPAEIGRLTGLSDLTISGNAITSLPPEIGQLSELRTFRAERTLLTTIPVEFGALTKLEILDLSPMTELRGDISPWMRPLHDNSPGLTNIDLGSEHCLSTGGDAALATWLDEVAGNWQWSCE